jgi:myo-inositol-1(or 4)-monophosphatase
MYSKKVVPVIREAGKLLLKYYGNVNNDRIRHKEDTAHSVVTDLDQKTEKFIAKKLFKLYPSIDFYGEEFGGNNKSDKYWLVDPIDGTSHFIRGIPFCTTMIALIESGEVVFSAIHDFVRNETVYAEKGLGAKMNNKSIHVSNRKLANAYMTFEINLKKKKNLDLFVSLRDKCNMFKTISAGFEYCLVAQGKIEGRISVDPFGNDYDYAPGAFLVKEAGGKVFNIGKNSYDYKNHNHIAANSKVYNELKKFYKW